MKVKNVNVKRLERGARNRGDGRGGSLAPARISGLSLVVGHLCVLRWPTDEARESGCSGTPGMDGLVVDVVVSSMLTAWAQGMLLFAARTAINGSRRRDSATQQMPKVQRATRTVTVSAYSPP